MNPNQLRCAVSLLIIPFALYAQTGIGANNNTFLGASALGNNTSGVNNTASGYGALATNTLGVNNTATGAVAMLDNTTGTQNTATGTGALEFNTSASGNTATGHGAMQLNTTGGFNTAIGYAALQYNKTGDDNIAIGVAAAKNVSPANSNNIHIGSLGTPNDNGTIRIGTTRSAGGLDFGTQTSFFIAGVRGVTTANNDSIPVVIDSNGQLGTVSSSRRFKEDIQEMGEASHGLMRLRPVTFRYQKPFENGSKPVQYGLIAEEVGAVFPDLVARSADGEIEAVKYQVLDSMLLNELQKQHQKVQQQAETIRLLENRLTALEVLMSSKLPTLATVGSDFIPK